MNLVRTRMIGFKFSVNSFPNFQATAIVPTWCLQRELSSRKPAWWLQRHWRPSSRVDKPWSNPWLAPHRLPVHWLRASSQDSTLSLALANTSTWAISRYGCWPFRIAPKDWYEWMFQLLYYPLEMTVTARNSSFNVEMGTWNKEMGFKKAANYEHSPIPRFFRIGKKWVKFSRLCSERVGYRGWGLKTFDFFSNWTETGKENLGKCIN